MNIIVKAVIALLIGVFVAFVVGKICVHFKIDPFWGWLSGVVAGLLYFFGDKINPAV